MKKYLQSFVLILIITFLIIPFHALALTDDQRFEIERRPYFDKTDCAPQGNGEVTVKKAYLLGDSKSVQLGGVGAIDTKFQNAGWELTRNSVNGRSYNTPGNGGNVPGIGASNRAAQTGLDAIVTDRDTIASANAIIIELGTNPPTGDIGLIFTSQMVDAINKIKAINPNADYYYLDIGATANPQLYSTRNNSIYSQAGLLGYQIISEYKNTFGQNSDPTNIPGPRNINDRTQSSPPADTKNYLVDDFIHYTTDGAKSTATLITRSVTGENGDTPVQNDLAQCCSSSVGASGGGDFSGSNNGQISFNFFVSKGLTKEQSAGIVGNLQAESGIDPKSVQPGGDGRGIAQWDKDDRWINLQNFARATNSDPLTLKTQLAFLWFELTGEPPTTGATGGSENVAYEDLKLQTTVASATESFVLKFERAGIVALEKRVGFAQQAFDTYGPLSGNGPLLGSGDACVGELGVNGEGGINAFPTRITKTQIQAGAEGAKWCFAATTNCHHDYNAADIHALPGTVVQSVSDGTVVSVTDAVGGVGSRVTIRGGDGKYIYYYAHMAAGSLAVTEGQAVAVGQQLGLVGERAQAVGTAPHLHFDMLPADQFDRRVSCSSASCTPYPFIDVQPLLHRIYEQLPN